MGEHLTPYLDAQGYEIWASFHRHRKPFPFPLRWRRCDITRASEVHKLVREAQPHYIFHLAGQPVPADSWKDPEKTLRLNGGGSLAVLEAVARYASKARVVFISTIHVYGNSFLQGKPVKEGSPVYPFSPYAGSKLLMELAAKNFARCHRVHTTIVRAANQVGRGQNLSYSFTSFCRQVARMEARRQKLSACGGSTPLCRSLPHPSHFRVEA